MRPSTFHLLHLPLVTLSIVFQCMLPQEVIRNSFTSNRSYNVTKKLRKKPNGKLEVCLGENAYIVFPEEYSDWFCYVHEVSELPEGSDFEQLKIRDTVVRVNEEIDSTHVFFDDIDRFVGFKTICEYVTDFYDLSIHRLRINAEKCLDDPKRVIDWVFSRQKILPVCYYQCEKSGDNELKCFLDEIGDRVSGGLHINVATSENFQYEFKQPLNLKLIKCLRASWLSINNLIDMNVCSLFLYDTNLTSENINLFLKNFLNGGNSNLVFMLNRLEQTDTEIILRGIEFTRREHPNILRYSYMKDKECIFNRSIELRKTDGTVVSILDNGAFVMMVWPDVNGRLYPVQELN